MLILNKEKLKNTEEWLRADIELPKFDYETMLNKSYENPTWVHFGAGNIFRGFPAMLQQQLLNCGNVETGIIAVETYDYEIIDRIYRPYDNLSLLVIMNPDGTLKKTVVGSICESLVGDPSRKNDWERLKEIFAKPSLKMASFTITEKGYNLKNFLGDYLDDVLEDMSKGPMYPKSVMGKIASLAYIRFKNGKLPLAFVSMDNCSRNGEKLYNAINTIVEKWRLNGLVENEFLEYINNPQYVSFPWSMIDKITPRPSAAIKDILDKTGFGSTEIICTDKKTYIAPFVNTEEPQYLVIEDKFPNGRIPLDLVGVNFTDRQTVEKAEKMKVSTCLNPLHTSLAVFGCLLGFKTIADEMKDRCLNELVKKIGFEEGMPVVANPGIINPESFINEVINVRLPNPYIPDTPQRIVTDTSQKIAIRFGETIKSYYKSKDLDVKNLKYIPLVIAGWCRYLMGIDDNGDKMDLSPDPLMNNLKECISQIKLGDKENVNNCLKPILSNEVIFGINLYSIGLGEKIENYFEELIAGKGAVRSTLRKYLNCN
ncbi:mannitol dehydrogenase family protein [Thermoanaerobacterium sp. RBIITD]|uniref:mannitol dehydrogenase family protein n=1 Tax=Thermoanaerobacterium sp. RBIITD TaxID=1550240 RepID=UPI000BB6B300|nr:mannitol dehydrogenase family protein [Thermoanaerobacterium sp. RBIITD]